MELSIIYELIYSKHIDKWRSQLVKDDECGTVKAVQISKNNLFDQLDDKQKKLAEQYALSIENNFDYIAHEINIKILNLAIEIGMQLQEAFSNDSGY